MNPKNVSVMDVILKIVVEKIGNAKPMNIVMAQKILVLVKSHVQDQILVGVAGTAQAKMYVFGMHLKDAIVVQMLVHPQGIVMR